MKKIINEYKELCFFFGLVILFFIWSFDNFFLQAKAGLDPSWILGLNWAGKNGARWGKDFIFTYGPLYHLSGCAVPAFYSPKGFLLINFGINLFIAAIKAGIVRLFYRKNVSAYGTYSVIFSTIVLLLCVNYNMDINYLYPELIILFATVLLCDVFYKFYKNDTAANGEIIVNIIIASLLMAVVQYVKFSFFNVAAVLLFLFIIFSVIHRKFKISLVFLSSYIFFSVLLWIVSGQNIKDLPGYVYTGFQLSSGYTSAMNIYYSGTVVLFFFAFAFVITGTFVIMLIYFLIKKKYINFILYFFISPQLFLLFKEGFVRADGHAFIFISTLPLIAVYLLYVSVLLYQPAPEQQKRILITCKSYYILITAVIVTLASMFVTKTTVIPNKAFQILKNYARYEKRIESSKQEIKDYYGNFKELARYTDINEKTDIFPWDISLLYAYNLDWRPRPVIQSFTNYTSPLDKITAKHFLSEKAPDKLIYGVAAIDGRYALFDEPETFRTVLTNYSSVAGNDTYLILEKKQRINPEKIKKTHGITVKKDETIEIPIQKDAYIFMEAEWNFTLLGRLADFLFKTTYAFIELQTADGYSEKYRFVHKVAANGLFVSKYVTNAAELRQVFDRDFTPDITGVRISGNSLFYKKDIKIKFYEITF